MDSELIAMCDTPEIQDRWEPKMGDRYITRRDMAEWIFWGKPLPTETKANKIYIPRIEDALEWLVPKHFVSWSSAHSLVQEFYYSYDMAIKGWLVMAMKLEHNKTWNGKAWA